MGISAKMVLLELTISIDDAIKLFQLQYGYFELTQTPIGDSGASDESKNSKFLKTPRMS